MLTSCEETEFLRILHKSPRWRRVYFDEVAVIFVKNTFENSEVLKNEISFKETYPVHGKLKQDAFQAFELYQASKNPIRQFLNRLYQPQRFPAEPLRKGNVFASLGYFGQAEELYLKALLEGPEYYESLFNLGNLYLFTDRYPDAVRCYLEVLEMNPRDREVRGRASRCLQQLAHSNFYRQK